MKKYTPFFKTGDNPHKWCVVDADGQILGRLATSVAHRLRGKNKPTFTPNADMGDGVIVINAEKIHLTGAKRKQKVYYRHSGYIGGLKEITADKLLSKKPETVIRHAVKGMLPKNRLGRKLLKRLRVYPGPDHPHEAQQPESMPLDTRAGAENG